MYESDDRTVPADRRRAPRYPAARLPSLRASILAGPDVSVINVSRGGLLLESHVRLRPGFGICLNLTLDGTIHVLNGRVTRVDAKIADGRVIYLAGVILDQETDIFDRPNVAAPNMPVAERVPEEPLSVSPIGETPDVGGEIRSLREQLDAERRGREEQAAVISAMQQALQEGERLRHELGLTHAAERSRWDEEQRHLEERVREAEEQAASMVQDMRAARDATRRLTQEHRQAVSGLETGLREKEQQLVELRAAQAALLESLTRRLEVHERKEATVKAQQDRMSAQLTTTEGWCADQQDLLYRIRQQMNTVFALLQGADPAPDRGLGSWHEPRLSSALDLPPLLVPGQPATHATTPRRPVGADGTGDIEHVARKTGT